MLKVFSDLHHGDLYYSLHSLFEKRLGFELYRPIGLDWFHAGHWKIAAPYGNAIDTANQYLDINNFGFDINLNLNGSHYVKDGIYHIHEPTHDYYQKAITLEQFKNMKFDIMMPTYSPHDYEYEKLRNLYQPNAKMVCHLGNTKQRTHLPNVLTSVPYNKASKQNVVYCHQELDPKLYSYEEPKNKNIINAVVSCFPYPEVWNKYKNLLSDISMKYYGSGSPEGPVHGAKGVAEKMIESNIGWHLKPHGGLGHTAMGWMYCGRPIITNMSQHRSWGGDAVRLFEPGVTCHDIEAHSPEENCAMIRKMLEPEENIRWCERARARFIDIINYDREEQDVRKFLEVIL